MSATRAYGDANLNGADQDRPHQDYLQQRRMTRDFGAALANGLQFNQATANGGGIAHHQVVFKAFTRESLEDIQKRRASRVIAGSNRKQSSAFLAQQNTSKSLDNTSTGGAQTTFFAPIPNEPDPYLASGQQLPPALVRQMPPELVGKPIEDIDPYYSDQETFVIISKSKELTRFSAKKALYLFGPFHPIRKVVLYILVSSLFNLFVMLTILVNCILMTIQGSETVERTEIIFTIIYTTEMGLKVLARGFILEQFTYLRDPWNWLDFAVIVMAYLTIIIQDLGNLSVMRTFRVLRALKTVAIIPGMKTIVGAVIDSVKNLKDVVVLTLFSLSVFSLLGLQIYMGLLTQKCILNGPKNMSDEQWHSWCSNSTNWIPEPDDEIWGAYRLCGNATGAQSCPEDHTCLQGFGPNPDYGYTNFDTFGWALICSFRLMTQDFWEGLYMQVLKTAGSWHIIFFIVSIFLGSIYLMNLILAIVAMSYNELQRRAEEEEEAAAEDEAAFLESCRLMELQQLDQMSQFSRSTAEGAATSYRPSVEIGLVGQSILASLCQNGLLGERVREKLDQQMMLPSMDFLGFGGFGGLAGGEAAASRAYHQLASRSHSLCAQQSTLVPSMAGYQQQQQNQHRHAIMTNNKRQYYDPLTMATSMTELRRKSSVRTLDSQSPVHSQKSRSSLVGQRRLLPNIGMSGQRLAEPRSRSQSKAASTHLLLVNNNSQNNDNNNRNYCQAHQYSSSGVINGPASKLPGGRGDLRNKSSFSGEQTSAKRYETRSSTTSDRDLQLLKQRAAMIRIVSDDCSNLNDDHADSTKDHQSNNADVANTPSSPTTNLESHMLRRSSCEAKSLDDSSSNQFDGRHLFKMSTSHPIQGPSVSEADSFESDSAVCVQPSKTHPLGRRLSSNPSKQLQRIPSTQQQVLQSHQSGHRSSLRASDRRNSISSPHRRHSMNPRRCSIMSSHEKNQKQLADSPQHLKVGSRLAPLVAHQTALSTNPAANQQSSPTSTTASSSPSRKTVVSGTSEVLVASHSTKHLAATSGSSTVTEPFCLKPETLGKPHHLSVENFQQFGNNNFGAIRQQPAAAQQASKFDYKRAQDIHRSMVSSNISTSNTLTEHELLKNQQRFNNRTASYIHPATMAAARSSFSQQHFLQRHNNRRQSGIHYLGPMSSATTNMGPPSEMSIYQQAHELQYGAAGPGSGVRRVSRDFVRRASEWSRLSMSNNVDLRRLLRLWAHSNPYQGNRNSFGSACSNQSQFFGAQFAGASDSAAHLQQATAQQSPRPSSVGSQAWQAYEILSTMSRRENRFQTATRAHGAGALPLDDSLCAEKMSISNRDKCLAYCLSCLDILCIWECCGAWLKVQRLITLIVFDPFTELFIILCILINTLFMALDSDDADEQMQKIFERGNYFFTATFALEASMKIMALSPKFYFREGWNVFDSIIVGLSLLELGLEGVYGLSVLRSFRLLRVFKLAKSWPTLNLLISIMGKAVGDLGNLTFVLAIIVFIFAVMGMQLFGTKYVAKNFPSGQLPRWNFTDFMHSFMIVFRILCAEWIEPMWDCLQVGGWPCIPFFLIAVTVGNLVVLNLFLALLLASFGASNLSSPQADNVDTKKLQEAISRFKRFGNWLRRIVARTLSFTADCLLCRSNSKRRQRRQKRRQERSGKHRSLRSNQRLSSGNFAIAGPDDKEDEAASTSNEDDNDDDDEDDDDEPLGEKSAAKSAIVSMSRLERLQNIERRTEELKSKIRRSPEHHFHLRQLAKSQLEAVQHHPTHHHYHEVSPGQNVGAANFNYNYSTRKGGNSATSDPKHICNPESNSGLSQQAQHKTLIPIIVDEAVDHSANCSSADDDTQSHNNKHCQQQSQYQEVPRQSQQCTCDEQSISSMATNSPDRDYGDVLLRECDFKRLESCDNESAVLQHTSSRPSVVVPYANNMTTIREDSKDDTMSQATIESAIDQHQRQQRPKLQLQSDSNLLNSDSNQATSVGEEDSSEQQQQLEPLLGSKNSEQAVAKVEISLGGHNNDNDSQRAASKRLAKAKKVLGDDQLISGDIDDADLAQRPKSSLYLRAPKRQEMEEEDEKTLQHIESYIEKYICIGIICLKWFLFRQHIRKIVEHKYFDQCILMLIVISSGTLALEDKHLNERPRLKQTLDVLDTIFTIIFSLEMIFKWLAFGIRRYFGNIWSWLDFVIVLVSFINLMASIFGSGKIQALKTMRTLRAMRGLRPLRALQRFQGMRVVVNALIQAIPSIFNVLLVCLIFWLIFSIMGVQMFGGKFWRCLQPATNELVSYEIAANKYECIERNLTWSNPQINFDNVLNAYLALFQVATFKGWIDIMNSATDSRMRDDQPIREANIYMYFYFVFFVIFGSFFTLNLFIGVIIDNFNEQKKKTGGSLEIFMTDDQKKYYHAMKKMRSKKPVKAMTRPKFKLQAYMFDLTTSKRFDLAIMLIIGLNMFVMALEHYGQSQEFTQALEILNLSFIAIFTLECLCKIFAMRHFYFREPWNIFDFIVVSLSILGVVMKEYVAKYFVSPTLLRVVRVVKVGRVLRLVKGAKGIRTLLFALAMSLPALFNICLLLFLVMFIYAIFGMSFFMNVRKRSGIDETFNFETFSSSIIVLFQMSTSAGWDLVLDPLMDEENDCQKADPIQGIEGTCGNKGIAIAYLISYVIVTFLIIINMYIAVILENYSQATEDVQEGLTDDDYEMYYEIWQKFDPNGTQYLPYEKLSDFVDALEDPLRIAKPNELALVVLDINIYEGNQCYCVDILDALTKYFFTRKGLDIQVNEHLRQVQSTLHETPFEKLTTTYMLKREHYCAKLIQRCWRKWRDRTRVPVTNQADQLQQQVSKLSKGSLAEDFDQTAGTSSNNVAV